MPKRRKELLVVKIVDFTKDKDEPAFDVEVFKEGRFISAGAGVFSTRSQTKVEAMLKAKEFAKYHIDMLPLKEE